MGLRRKMAMKGIYCLLIKLGKNSLLEVGKLGKIALKKGHYVYVGSALNSLEKRVQRHFRREKKMHWHIDYLLASRNAEIKKAYVKETIEREECTIAKKIAANATAIKGFGCSDCNCESHLFKVEGKFDGLYGFKEMERNET